MDTDYSRLAPIPTYEEAISRPSSSQQNLGPSQIGDDAERQGFLRGYRTATVESARNSEDSDLSVPDMVDAENHDRRQIEELDYMEPGDDDSSFHRARLRSKFAQRLSSLSATLSSIRLPRFRRIYAPVTEESEAPDTPRSSWNIPPQYRLSIPTFARLFALLMIAGLIWLLFALDLFPSAVRRHNLMITIFDPDTIKQFAQDQVDILNMEGYIDHLTTFAHVAGSEGDAYLARWVESTWTQVARLDDITLLDHDIAADYPGTYGESLIEASMASKNYQFQTFLQDTGRGPSAWHGYGASGSVEGPLIYADGGSQDDFARLHEQGILTNGTVALIRSDHGSKSAAIQIRRAGEAGCIGAIIFNGESATNEEHGLESSDASHRENAVMRNWALGDINGIDPAILPSIPSLPLPWSSARELLSKISTGVQNDYGYIGRLYTGNGSTNTWRQDELIVKLKSENDKSNKQKIWNVHALMQGVETPDHKVIVGAHRDSWCLGASTAGFSTAILTEVVKVFGNLRYQQWQPLRSIEFVSWDGYVFNSAGSTKYVESSIEALKQSGVAYIDVGQLAGDMMEVRGSPLLERCLRHAMNRVSAPNETSLRNHYDGLDLDEAFTPFLPVGGDSDAAPFANIAGVPSLTTPFGKRSEVDGSCHDTLDWLHNYSSEYYESVAQMIALIVLDLATAPLIPLDTRVYADRLHDWIQELEGKANKLDTSSLHEAADDLRAQADMFHDFDDKWTTRVLNQGGMEDLFWHHSRMLWNNKLVEFEKQFLDVTDMKKDDVRLGLKQRPQYKNLMHAPNRWWPEDIDVFPSVLDLYEQEKFDEAQEELERVADVVRKAGESLSFE